MTTSDEPITRNYDSDKEKSEIDSDNRVLKIRQRLAAYSGRRNGIFAMKLDFPYWQSTVCLVTLLCDFLLSSFISRHALCLYGHALNIYGSLFYETITLGGHCSLVMTLTSKWPWGRVSSTCPLEFLVLLSTRKSFLTRHGWATFSGYSKTREGKEGEKGEEKAGEV